MFQMINRSATRVRRTQADRREDSERGLVSAAISVTAERGVSAATFEAIGQRGGYSRSLVTRRFDSKQGLIDAVSAISMTAEECWPQSSASIRCLGLMRCSPTRTSICAACPRRRAEGLLHDAVCRSSRCELIAYVLRRSA